MLYKIPCPDRDADGSDKHYGSGRWNSLGIQLKD